MTITADLVEAYLKCPTKCFLLSHGEVGTGNPYAQWTRTKSARFRAEGVQRLLAGLTPEQSAASMLGIESLRAAQWPAAVNFVVSGNNLEGACHVVERIPPSRRGGAEQFAPIRFVFRNKLTRDDKLVIAFDGLALAEMLGQTVEIAKIVHGDSYAVVKVKTSTFADEITTLTENVGALVATVSPPALVLNRHCPECEFQGRCRQKAIEQDDLSLLGGMTVRERADFNSKGIFTVSQLSYTFRPRRRPKELKDKPERYHHSLKARAIRERKIHIAGTPGMIIQGTPVYLDVEALPDQDFYYLIGARVKAGDSVVQHSLWADSPSDEGRIWQEFLLKLADVQNPVLVHYGKFESTFLKKMRERHGVSLAGLATTKALEARVNLLSIIFGQIYFPTHSNRLKEIAGCLGFRWSDENACGLQSILWRHDWEQTRDPLVKEKLVRYNAEDCAALELVAHTVAQVIKQNIGSTSETTNRLEVVAANNADCKLTMWPRFSSSIEGLESINRAARWDYQRDHIYIRTGEEPRRARRRSRNLAGGRTPIRKTVVCEPPQVCPRCQRKGTQMFRTVTKCLQDLRFSTCGVAGSIVKYQFQVFWCPACEEFTPWPREFWDRTTFGRNLAAFAIFEIIELCVSQRSVTHALNRLFGFRMEEIAVRRLKRRGAEYYRETRKNLLADMLKGNVIHADETRIKLHDKTAYVWVFATSQKVVYFYCETREGSFVQETLQGFQGVLVSDFYAAYDSISCPQQKCILHLIRDLNDAVSDNPYDESTKGIVTTFADLFRAIVATIDRWGLKSRFLRKHQLDVDRFYKRISRMKHLSVPASKLKARLEKDRGKLFTFLNHDGVPWNNNNAEHAIKAFARLRRAIEGLSSARGIEEYLILLSICQTCKYSGFDFLDFLRSGETNFTTFAASQR